jgi:protocatechuate 3,4-dioxygenase beta subunit
MVLMVLGTSSAAQGPVPQPRDGVITGQVVDAGSGRPVSAAIVQISGAPLGGRTGPASGAPPRILTGGDGRFVFRDLPSGSFTIAATKGGYTDGASGRRVIGAPAQPVVLTAAQRTAEVAVRIWKNAVIAGTIVDEAGEPVVGMQVRAARRVFSTGRRRFIPGAASAATDDRGMYRLSNLIPGEYLIAVSPPAVSASVSLFADVARTGRGSGEMTALSVSGSANGIQIGDAQVTLGRGGAIPPPPVRGRMQIYPTMFYPAARAPAQATTITLGSGEERIGIDLQIQPVATARVSGTLVAPAGPAAMTTLRLVPAGAEEIAQEALAPVSFADASGNFTFAVVPPGQYSLRAASRVGPAEISRPGSEMYWLDLPVTVSGDDVDGVTAIMRPALRITARLEFEGATPRPAASSPRPGQFVQAPFSLESDDAVAPGGMGGPSASAGESGFTLAGYAAGRYRVRVQNSPAGWMFKAAMLNGVDVSETPFDFTRDVTDLVLTFTDRWSGMSGVVQGAGGGGAMVLAFTTNVQAWNEQAASPRRLKRTRANARGEFGISSVPPGDYYVSAVPEEQAADWPDPKALEALARVATQVTIAEGEHKTIDLRLKDVRQ